MLPAVTLVTLLPKHSSVNLQFKLKYLFPYVTCGYPCYPVTQTQSSIFAIQVDASVSLCYLRLPVLHCYPNTVQYICNSSGCICVPVLPAVTRVTLLLKHSPVYLQFKLRNLCPCVTCGYPCYPVTQTQSSKFAFNLDVFMSLCYLQLPLLPYYPNIDQ